MFSDSTANAAKERCPKITAKDSKIQQYAVLAKHIFAAKPSQSALHLQKSGRFATIVETHLQWYIVLCTYRCLLIMYN
jgi:hypothetical protein